MQVRFLPTVIAGSQVDYLIFNDVICSQLRCRSGEKVIDRLESVEDTKGNNGDRGTVILVFSHFTVSC